MASEVDDAVHVRGRAKMWQADRRQHVEFGGSSGAASRRGMVTGGKSWHALHCARGAGGVRPRGSRPGPRRLGVRLKWHHTLHVAFVVSYASCAPTRPPCEHDRGLRRVVVAGLDDVRGDDVAVAQASGLVLRSGEVPSRCRSWAPTPRVVGSVEPSSAAGGFACPLPPWHVVHDVTVTSTVPFIVTRIVARSARVARRARRGRRRRDARPARVARRRRSWQPLHRICDGSLHSASATRRGSTCSCTLRVVVPPGGLRVALHREARRSGRSRRRRRSRGARRPRCVCAGTWWHVSQNRWCAQCAPVDGRGVPWLPWHVVHAEGPSGAEWQPPCDCSSRRRRRPRSRRRGTAGSARAETRST